MQMKRIWLGVSTRFEHMNALRSQLNFLRAAKKDIVISELSRAIESLNGALRILLCVLFFYLLCMQTHSASWQVQAFHKHNGVQLQRRVRCSWGLRAVTLCVWWSGRNPLNATQNIWGLPLFVSKIFLTFSTIYNYFKKNTFMHD